MRCLLKSWPRIADDRLETCPTIAAENYFTFRSITRLSATEQPWPLA